MQVDYSVRFPRGKEVRAALKMVMLFEKFVDREV